MHIHHYTLQNFKPKIINDLIRVGNKEKDGGYLISKRQIGITKILIGLGVHYDWTFEEEFKKDRQDILLYCFDFSVGKAQYLKNFALSIFNVLSINTYANILYKKTPLLILTKPVDDIRTYFKFGSFFNPKKNNYFFQKGISDYRSKKFITVSDMFDKIKLLDTFPDDSIFLKMDIEGSEYDILEDILKYSSKINGMVIEFHNLKQLWNEFNYLMDELKKSFEIIHIHGNNCCGYISDKQIPNLIEISLIKRKFLLDDEINAINNKSYPLEDLDKPNFNNISDLKLSFQ